MPRTAIDYSNTVIYKIVSKDLNLNFCYVGHTTDFIRRKAEHKKRSKNILINNTKLYKSIFDNGGWGEFDMVVVENYNDCKNGIDACTRERYWYEKLNANLNTFIPIRTDEERPICYGKYEKKKYCYNPKIKLPSQLYPDLYDITKKPEWLLNNIENHNKWNKIK